MVDSGQPQGPAQPGARAAPRGPRPTSQTVPRNLRGEAMPLRSDSENFALIRVIGVGGGGSNAVNRMIRAEMMGVEFIACNTDAQALLQSDAPHKIRIGDKITRGLGAGGASAIGHRAAQEAADKHGGVAHESGIGFNSTVPGAASGSGATPLVAEVAKEPGALTIGV